MARSTGSNSNGSRNSSLCCDHSCISHTRSYKLSPRCEATSEERSAGNPHATFCGSRRWATTSGHAVYRVSGIPTVIANDPSRIEFFGITSVTVTLERRYALRAGRRPGLQDKRSDPNRAAQQCVPVLQPDERRFSPHGCTPPPFGMHLQRELADRSR